MKVDQVVRDAKRKLQEIVRALDNNLTARDNFAPEGTLGQVLTSNGPNTPPSYQSPSTGEGSELSWDEIQELISVTFDL